MLLQEERELVREYGIKMIEANLTSGTSGNISVFNRELGLYAMSPSSMDYHIIQTEDVVVMDLEGNIVDGSRRPSIEHVMSRNFYKYRDDINAVVHTHSSYATAASCLAKPLPALHFMQLLCGQNEIPCAPFVFPGTEELATAAFESMKGLKATLLSNHGLIVGSHSIQNAFYIAAELEEMAKVYYIAKSMGEPQILTEEMTKGLVIG